MNERVNTHAGACACRCNRDHGAWSPQELFAKPLEMSEEIVDYLFRLQSDLAEHEGALSQLWIDWWKQSQSTFITWNDLQRQLADAWVDAMNLYLPSEPQTVSENTDSVMENWRDAASQMLKIQNEWLQLCSITLGRDQRASAPEMPTGGLGRFPEMTSPKKSTHVGRVSAA